MMQSLEGTLEKITYYNEETFFLVARLRSSENQLTTIIGNMPQFSVGERLLVRGEWVHHKSFGRQFKVADYELLTPQSEKGIRNFLASGLIRGVGPSTAEKIVDHFGLKALDIIEKEPGRLCEIPGIGEKKAALIAAGLQERREIVNVMTFLAGCGVGAGYAARIYRRYGEETIAKVKENPYRLAEDVFGIGFKTADKIALEMGLAADSPYRIRAALVFYLKEAQEQGHVFLPRSELIAKVREALSLPEQTIGEELIDCQLELLAADRRLIVEERPEEAVYSAPLYYAECYVARRLLQLARSSQEIPVLKSFLQAEREGFKLAPAQKEAVLMAHKTGLLVITGGPGTGKTTIVKTLLELFRQNGLEVLLAAPTGRAAKRLTETAGMEAKTIHRLLEYSQTEGQGFSFQRTEERPLKAHVVIIDEMSMVDLPLFYHLLKAIPGGCKLVLVGDMDQLPSVGPGNVLRDIISSGAIPVVRLKEIFRQSEKSRIVSNAHAVNRGKMPQTKGSDDFFFLSESDPEKILHLILDLCSRRLPLYKNKDAIDDIQVLAPMRRTLIGVDNLNKNLQEKLNPPAPHKTEMKSGAVTFRLGDKVMQIRNNYQKEVFNGDIGRITYINNDDGELVVMYPDVSGQREVVYDQTELDELVLSYAVSVHKSQGSEYPIVVLPVVTQHYIMLQRNLLYTAITRAKELVVLIGTKKALAIAVRNNKVETRYTRLAARLAEAADPTGG